MTTPWLDPIPDSLHDMALEALARGDALGFLCRASNEDGLLLVLKNHLLLAERGIYESALLIAVTGTRTNNSGFPLNALKQMLAIADRERLRSAGQPLPGPGPFVLYRGVAGKGRARTIRGVSWTASLEKAWWFATRYGDRLPDPAVYRVVINADLVLAYSNDRQEQEFVVLLPDDVRPRRLR